MEPGEVPPPTRADAEAQRSHAQAHRGSDAGTRRHEVQGTVAASVQAAAAHASAAGADAGRAQAVLQQRQQQEQQRFPNLYATWGAYHQPQAQTHHEPRAFARHQAMSRGYFSVPTGQLPPHSQPYARLDTNAYGNHDHAAPPPRYAPPYASAPLQSRESDLPSQPTPYPHPSSAPASASSLHVPVQQPSFQIAQPTPRPQPAGGPTSEQSDVSYVRKTVQLLRNIDLSELCRQMGLSKTGTKSVLQERILERLSRATARERSQIRQYTANAYHNSGSSLRASTGGWPNRDDPDRSRVPPHRPLGANSTATGIAAYFSPTKAEYANEKPAPGMSLTPSCTPPSLHRATSAPPAPKKSAEGLCSICLRAPIAFRGESMLSCRVCKVCECSRCAGDPTPGSKRAAADPARFACAPCRLAESDPWLPLQTPATTCRESSLLGVATLEHPEYTRGSQDLAASGAVLCTARVMFDLSPGMWARLTRPNAAQAGSAGQTRVLCVRIASVLRNDRASRCYWPRYAKLTMNGQSWTSANLYKRNPAAPLGGQSRDDPVVLFGSDGPGIAPAPDTGLGAGGEAGKLMAAYVLCPGKNVIELRGAADRGQTPEHSYGAAPIGPAFQLVVQLVYAATFDDIRAQNIPDETPAEAESRVRRCIQGGGDGDSDDDAIVALSSSLPLKCPLTGRWADIPARGKTCRHLGVFDRDTYLEMQRRARKWKCPCCSADLPPGSLVVDGYANAALQTLRRKLGEDVWGEVDVEVDPDGRWRGVGQGDRARAAVQSAGLTAWRALGEEEKGGGEEEAEAEKDGGGGGGGGGDAPGVVDYGLPPGAEVILLSSDSEEE